MTLLQSIVLGIIQGLTEFLPVSSSAHLVLAPHFFGWEIPADQDFFFNVWVQIGTLLAVILYFWKDLVQIAVGWLRGLQTKRPFESGEARLGWYLILATIPAGLAGLLLKDQVEAAFASVQATAYFLLGTALLLTLAEWAGKRQRTLAQIGWLDALVMGIGQAAAIFPGISRSGSTMAAGLARHLDRPSAARFSFLMSIPIMLAAGALSLTDLGDVQNLAEFLPVMAAGFITSAGVGYLSIHWLLGYLARRSFYGFAVYVSLLAGLTLLSL